MIHGGVRDSRLIELGWPVFAERLCVRRAAKDLWGGGKLGEPVRLCDVTVGLDDLIVADTDCFVCVTKGIADEVRTRSVGREWTETEYIRRLRGDGTIGALYGLP